MLTSSWQTQQHCIRAHQDAFKGYRQQRTHKHVERRSLTTSSAVPAPAVAPSATTAAAAAGATVAAAAAGDSRWRMSATHLLSPGVVDHQAPKGTVAVSADSHGSGFVQDRTTSLSALDPLIQVSVNTNSGGVAKAVLLRLQQLGHAEVWATSAANHFTAIAGLALAAQQLQQHASPRANTTQSSTASLPQQLHTVLEGLVATATLSAHDQEVKDPQKRRLNKLQLLVQPGPQIDNTLLTVGQTGRISTNRTTSVPEIMALMKEQLLQPRDQSSSEVRPDAVCVVEARGEQAVTRALKAALSIQAAAGCQLEVRPIAGKVADVVAEKRGQTLLAEGLLLLFSWM